MAKSGAEFDSVAEALDSITDASADNPYVVLVFPGTYVETELVTVKEFVTLRGAGQNVTILRSERTASRTEPFP